MLPLLLLLYSIWMNAVQVFTYTAFVHAHSDGRLLTVGSVVNGQMTVCCGTPPTQMAHCRSEGRSPASVEKVRGLFQQRLGCCGREKWARIYVIHGASASTEYDPFDHTKVTWADATPEYWATVGPRPSTAAPLDDLTIEDILTSS